MVIVQREGKYFLQISNGELELSEKQAMSRIAKGLAVLKENSEYAPETDLGAFTQHTEETVAEQTATVVEAPASATETLESEAEPVANDNDTTSETSEDEASMTTSEEEAQQVTLVGEVSQLTSYDEDAPQLSSGDESLQATSEEVPAQPTPARGKVAAVPIDRIPNEAQAFILSDEYYDNIIREFEKVYVANGRKEETALELLDHCQKSIDHLKLERSQPNADLALLDYQRICWLRIIVFLQALTGVPAPKHPDVVAHEKEKLESERTLVKQLLVIQLLQETGAFPYADALKSITHDNIIGLVARILNKEKSVIKTAMQRSSDILLRRNVSTANAPKRLKMLIDIESYFTDLPYTHIMIRLRSLKEFYKNFGNK